MSQKPKAVADKKEQKKGDEGKQTNRTKALNLPENIEFKAQAMEFVRNKEHGKNISPDGAQPIQIPGLLRETKARPIKAKARIRPGFHHAEKRKKADVIDHHTGNGITVHHLDKVQKNGCREPEKEDPHGALDQRVIEAMINTEYP